MTFGMFDLLLATADATGEKYCSPLLTILSQAPVYHWLNFPDSHDAAATVPDFIAQGTGIQYLPVQLANDSIHCAP